MIFDQRLGMKSLRQAVTRVDACDVHYECSGQARPARDLRQRACAHYSTARCAVLAKLHLLAVPLSQSCITCAGMWVGIEDRAAVIYDVEFLRAYVSGRSVALAHRVALEQLALEHPSQAGIAFLLPGLMNGYGRVTEELKEIRQRLVALEQKVDALGR